MDPLVQLPFCPYQLCKCSHKLVPEIFLSVVSWVPVLKYNQHVPCSACREELFLEAFQHTKLPRLKQFIANCAPKDIPYIVHIRSFFYIRYLDTATFLAIRMQCNQMLYSKCNPPSDVHSSAVHRQQIASFVTQACLVKSRSLSRRTQRSCFSF